MRLLTLISTKLLLLITIAIFSAPINAENPQNLNEKLDAAIQLKSEQPDSTIIQIEALLPAFIQNKDTINIIRSQFELIDIYSGKGDYSKAYETLWATRPLVENSKFTEEKIILLIKLTTLYLVYDHNQKAIDIYNQLPKLIEEELSDPQLKLHYWGRYFSRGAWIELKTTKNYKKAEELALKSIDYFRQFDNELSGSHHTETLLADIYILSGQADKAAEILFRQNKYYPRPLKPNHALLYERLGEYYELVENGDSAIFYYMLSLEAIDKYNKLMDKKPLLLNNLAGIYSEKGNYKKAFELQKQAQHFNDLLFSSQISQNKQLFEIRDQYAEQIEKREAQIQEQQINLLNKENRLLQLRVIIITICLIAFASLIVSYVRRRSKKAMQKKEQEINDQKRSLEQKNKELMGSALQLLERENENADIKKQLDQLKVDGENAQIVQQIKNNLTIDKSHKWNEFEKRFTEVNDDFLDSLKKRYPKLSPTDLKMCAFIKLGFSSKEMAQIMSITPEGINTSRSRLRKKMELPREIVLSEFLQGF